MAYFGRVQAGVLYVYIFCHELHDCHSGSERKNIKIIQLSLSGRQTVSQLQLLATNTVHLFGFRRLWNINYYMWKTAPASKVKTQL